MKNEQRKKRRTRGNGSVYKVGRVWYFEYEDAEGKRCRESSRSENKTVASRLLDARVHALRNGHAAIPRVEQYTFGEAAQAKIDHSLNRGRKAVDELERRIRKHLIPFFGVKRPLVSITPTLIEQFVTKRKADTIVVFKARTLDDGTVVPEQRKAVSNGEINRELQALKSVLVRAVKDGKLARCPSIEQLPENNRRTGFFEPEQIASVLNHLPTELQAPIEFAYITGWRIASEVLPLEWRHVDFNAGEVRLDPGTTKNGDGRVFKMTRALRELLEAQKAERDKARKAGHIVNAVFFRTVAEGRGGEKKPQPIVSLNKAWKAACRAAGCPGRIPHDLRRTAVRNLVRAGVPETVAMEMTGHKTRSVFDRYDIVSKQDKFAAVQLLDAAYPEALRRRAPIAETA